MRILFTSAGGRGHSDPLLPIARAAQAAGHTVAFCCRPPMAAAIEAAGFRAFTAGPAIAVLSHVAPLLPLDTEREARVLRDGFAGRGIAPQRAAAVRELCEEWQPDLLVCDETDFGALVAGERLDIPYATVVVVAAGSFLRRDVIAEPLNDLRAEHGLEPDPQLEMLTRYLSFVPGPPSFRDPAFPLAPTAHAVRPAVLEPTPDEVPASAAAAAGTTTVYFTLGTVFNMESGDLFERVLVGLRELPVDVIATVGVEIDPATLRRAAAERPHRAIRPAVVGAPDVQRGRIARRLGDRPGRARVRPSVGAAPDGRRPTVQCGSVRIARYGAGPRRNVVHAARRARRRRGGARRAHLPRTGPPVA